jgi:hypothetical protein
MNCFIDGYTELEKVRMTLQKSGHIHFRSSDAEHPLQKVSSQYATPHAFAE